MVYPHKILILMLVLCVLLGAKILPIFTTQLFMRLLYNPINRYSEINSKILVFQIYLDFSKGWILSQLF